MLRALLVMAAIAVCVVLILIIAAVLGLELLKVALDHAGEQQDKERH